MTVSKIFFYFCLSFIGGIFFSSFFTPSFFVLGIGLILAILLISVFWQYKKTLVVGFSILFLVAGVWWHQRAELRVIYNELREYNDLDQKITLIGRVVREPDIRENRLRLIIQPENIKGRILVTTSRYPEYQYGDRLKIRGRLRTPQKIADFDYPGFLAKDGIYSLAFWPRIELLERGNYWSLTSTIYGKILAFKNKLRESIYQNLSPPQGSILGAMILGDRGGLSEDLRTRLSVTGVRHITAISGLHITVLTSILMTILIGLGLWRQQSFWFSVILITLFIIMTGLQPSAIRAGIMGGLFLLGQYLGRMSVSSRSIVIAATLMLVQNPLLLRFDVGFQLSFLAMMGIIYLMPIFQNWLKFIPWKNPKSVLSMTFAAYLFTLPTIIYNFGYMSLVAPITNILIIPFLPFIMLSGFIFSLIGIIFPLLGWIFSWPAWGLLTYLTTVVNWLSNFPLAYLMIENFHWIWLVISYSILGFLTWRLQETQKLKFLNH